MNQDQSQEERNQREAILCRENYNRGYAVGVMEGTDKQVEREESIRHQAIADKLKQLKEEIEKEMDKGGLSPEETDYSRGLNYCRSLISKLLLK
jgi:hypothetical protein